jgi:hypothetical protein
MPALATITSCAPNGELRSDPPTDRQTGTDQSPKLCQKPVSPFIVAPRAQASRRCETQATAALMWHVGSFGPVRHQLNQFLADAF